MCLLASISVVRLSTLPRLSISRQREWDRLQRDKKQEIRTGSNSLPSKTLSIQHSIQNNIQKSIQKSIQHHFLKFHLLHCRKPQSMSIRPRRQRSLFSATGANGWRCVEGRSILSWPWSVASKDTTALCACASYKISRARRCSVLVTS